MTKRAAVLAADIEPGMLVWVAEAKPASFLVSEVWRKPRAGQTGIRRANAKLWTWLDNDKTYPLIKERT